MSVSFLSDLRYSVRGLLARPGFALVAVLTLALGIGANTSIFSVLHGLYLRPLPYPDGERLVQVYNAYPNMGLENAGTSIPDYLDRRGQAASLADLALYTGQSYNLADDGAVPERLIGQRATPSLFTTLGVAAARGRVFDDEHAQPGNDRVVVLSHALWSNRFNADPALVGRDIRLSGQPYRVIGVMPEGFGFPGRSTQLWVPFAFTDAQRTDSERGNEFSESIGRLRPGASIEALNSEIDAIVARNAERLGALGGDAAGFADFLRGGNFTGRAVGLREFQIGDARQRALLLQVAVVLVLLIAIANVANLMMTRLTSRQKELSVRSALGASRLRIIRGVLMESMLLALIGGVVGVAIAWSTVEVLAEIVRSSGGDYLPQLDLQVLGFALGLSLFTGLVSALIPALALLRLNINDVIKEGGRLSGGGRGAAWSRNALVVGQISLATVLLIGAGLLLTSFRALQQQSPGFEAEGVATAMIALPPSKYPDHAPRAAVYEQALQRLREIPGVQQAGFVSSLPFSGQNASGSYGIDGYEVPAGQPSPHAMQRQVDEQYFALMGIPVLQGRGFEIGDSADAAPVVIIDELAARRYFRDRDPIGQRINRGGDSPWMTVVGVVAPIKHNSLAVETQKETLYVPFRQYNAPYGAFVVRAALPTSELLPRMRAAVLAADPEQPIHDIRTLDERVARSISEQRYVMHLVTAFAGVALLLSAIGIYGVLAFAVSQRTGELGVRMAIGARAGQIRQLVLGQGARLTATGLLIGVVAALLAAHAARALLFGVQPFAPWVYLPVVAFLGAVAMFACWLPARRASRIDPLVALRHG
jgi:predicted permease